MQITRNEIEYSIACANWPEFALGCSEAKVGVWHDGGVLHLRYSVTEDDVRAVCSADRQNAWEDSCVEFFFAPFGDGLYYNIECTCTGRLYMAVGRGREGREFLPEGAYAAVRRSASLGSEAFGLRKGPLSWEVRLDVPASVFSLHGFGSFEELTQARGNFYKCGNLLPHKHFLSYAPISTPGPDFHRPEFFEKIEFQL